MSASPMGFQYKTATTTETYLYEKNLQGDVVSVYSEAGVKLISYAYDAWGNANISFHNGVENTNATNNPFTYRGYYFDQDLGLYYLQSRYYDAKVGRFISADEIAVITASPSALTDKNLYAYCDNNPVMRGDDGGEFWNYIIGGLVGAVAGGVVAAISTYNPQDKSVDWASIGINVLAGAINGIVAASGLGMFAQAGISAVVSGACSFADQAQAKGLKNINGLDVASSAAIGFVTSVVGTAAGKLIGSHWANEAKDLIDLGQKKLLTGFIRRSLGQSYSKLMKQGYKFFAQAVKPTNIFRGISSVAGSIIGVGTGLGYNSLKQNWRW